MEHCVGTDGHSRRSLIRIQSEKYVDCGCTMSGVGKGTEREKIVTVAVTMSGVGKGTESRMYV